MEINYKESAKRLKLYMALVLDDRVTEEQIEEHLRKAIKVD